MALIRKDLASVRFALGEGSVAEELWTQAMQVLRAEKPSGSWELADADSHLGGRLAARDRFDEAEPLLRTGYETLRRLRGEAALYTRQARDRLGSFQHARATTMASTDDD